MKECFPYITQLKVDLKHIASCGSSDAPKSQDFWYLALKKKKNEKKKTEKPNEYDCSTVMKLKWDLRDVRKNNISCQDGNMRGKKLADLDN